jgi:hypothetical protein
VGDEQAGRAAFLFLQGQLGLGRAALLALLDEGGQLGVAGGGVGGQRVLGATAQKVTPMMVSARVVKTYSLPSWISAVGVRISCGKAKRTPSLLPIQFSCIRRTRSGQPTGSSGPRGCHALSSSSAYW